MGKFKTNNHNVVKKKGANSVKTANPAAMKAKGKGGRYFSKPIGTDENAVKKKNFGKNKPKSIQGGSGGGFHSTAPPKPKRLKKGPFKINNNKNIKVQPEALKPSLKPDGPKKAKSPKSKPKSGGKQEEIVKPKKKKKMMAKKNVGKDLNTEDMSKEVNEKVKTLKKNLNKDRSKSTKMIVQPGGRWYEEAETSNSSEKQEHEEIHLPKNEFFAMHKSATNLLESDAQAYKQSCLKGQDKGDFQWMEKMMKIGTLPDKMAAYVVKIQDSPVHNLHHLQNLISLVKLQSKQQCLMAADTLKDLFLEDLLPPGRKLISFEHRNTNLKLASKSDLIKWMYEDRLKLSFNSFIQSLKNMSLDNVEKIKAKSVLIIYQLLTAHPEQEEELLKMLVNKLGDPIKKVGSRALFYLTSLLEDHPRMKLVVIDEVERLLFRNNIAKRAQYYGICFLNSIDVDNEHPEVACKLINVYIAFFKGCIKTGDIESKMMSGLLTGINAAYPNAKEYGWNYTEGTDTLFKLVHLSSFTIGVQSLSILFQLTDANNFINRNETDRYYRVLYKQLLSPEVAVTSHTLEFLNLIFKSMKNDTNINRVMGFSKRLLQICQNVQPNLACAILFLLAEVSKTHSGIIRVGPTKQDDLVVKSDGESDVESDSESEHRISNLMKISNVNVGDTDIKQSKSKKNKKNAEDDTNTEAKSNKQVNITVVDLNTSNIIQEDDEKTIIKSEYKQQISEYDPNARNPGYSGAEFSLLHEIVPLTNHYHPSVAQFAQIILNKQPLVYEGNPLKDFTISRFLERFVYKNPKKMKNVARSSYKPKGLRNLPVNSAKYLTHDETQIPEEEKFFYRYFKNKQATATSNDDSDVESVGDDEFDELMANYFQSTKKNKNADDLEGDLDFAGDIHSKTPGKKAKKKQESDDDESGMEDDVEDDFVPSDDADEMLDMDDDADEMLDMDDNDDDLDFQEEDGLDVFEMEDDIPSHKKRKKFKKDADMFAPAEEFAEMLESNAEIGLAGPSTLINKDNADPKQLKWEMDRDRWMKGYKKSSKTTFKSKGKRSRKH